MRDLLDTPASILSHFADPEAVESFIAWRKKIKKPLTDRAANMIAKTLKAINDAGGCGTEALDTAQERGWMTIKADWYWRDKNGQQPNRMAGHQAPGGNTGEESALRAASFIRTPSSGCF